MSPPTLCLHTILAHSAHTLQPNTSTPSLRPLLGMAGSHRRLSLPRAESPTCWAPRLAVPPSRPESFTGNAPSPASRLLTSKTILGTNIFPRAPHHGPCILGNHKPLIGFSLPSPCTYVHEGETTLGIAHLRACQEMSYSGPIRLPLAITAQAVHCNGLHPSLDPGEHTII